jgi:hypothetical protein
MFRLWVCLMLTPRLFAGVPPEGFVQHHPAFPASDKIRENIEKMRQ